MYGAAANPGSRPLALIIESDSLTLWSLSSYLTSSFEVELASAPADALAHLDRPELRVIICGSPIIDADPEVLEQLAGNPSHTVIALVSDTTRCVPDNVLVVEKPFALEQLAKLLATHSANTGT